MLTLTDERSQEIISFVAYNAALLYITWDAANQPGYYPYPEKPGYMGHVWYFVWSVLKIHFWALIALYITLAVLLVAKFALVDLVRSDTFSTKDLHQVLTRFLWTRDAFILKLLVSHVVVAVIFATIASEPNVKNYDQENTFRYFALALSTVHIAMSVIKLSSS